MSTRHLKAIVLGLIVAGCDPRGDEPTPVFQPRQGEKIEQHAVRLHHPSFGQGQKRELKLSRRMDRDGLPVEYGMWVESVYCLEDRCEVINVKMVWDVLGRFSRYELPAGKVLTKNDHVPFTPEDHEKLRTVLGNVNSILRDHNLETLTRTVKTTQRDEEGGWVDAITRATETTIKNAVVQGATYTSYNLWHWANGEASEEIRKLTHQICSKALLLRFLLGGRSHEILFGIEHLGQHRIFDGDAVAAVTGVMRNGERDQMDAGMAYLRAALPDPAEFHQHVGRLFGDSNRNAQIYLLGLLAKETDLPDALYEQLVAQIPHFEEFYELHLLLRLLEDRNYASEQTLAHVAALLEHENFFLARRACWFLQKQKLSPDLQRKVKAFQEKNADRM